MAITGVKTVEWYLNQYNQSDKSSMMKVTPGIYLEWLPSDTQQLGNGIQQTNGQLVIHLVTTSLLVGDKRIKKTDDKDHLKLFEEIYKVVNSKSGLLSDITGNEALADTPNDCKLFNALKRDHITPPHELKRLMVSQQRFKGLFYDHSASKTYTPNPVPPEITIEPLS